VIDINELDYNALIDLRARVDERITNMRESGVPELRAKFSEAAAALGLSLDQVLGAPKKRRGRPPAQQETAE
jgi:hypothetical protein